MSKKSTGRRAEVNRAGSAREVPASEVKNAWHSYLDRVSQAREEIVVTRYGKPMAKLTPYEEAAATTAGFFGCLAGTVTVHAGIISPTGEAWEADA